MAKYKQVGYGSQGSDVTELQKLLNKNGYTLAEDGIFGSKTQAAVKDYQKKNGLTIDGIVGDKTWGAIQNTTYSTASSSNANTTPDKSASNTPASGGYQESDAVRQAQQMLEEHISQKPGGYQSAWQSQLDDILGRILNREEFSYDLNGDALYQQYKDQYMLQGQQAMMDTMGQAAALTGGYGNSYAQTAGQQAYQGHLQQLNDRIPELYQLALSKYQMEGDALADQYSMIGAREEQDYARYQDDVSAYQAELDRLTNQYNTERDYDYGKYADERDFAYAQGRDKTEDEQWQKEFDEAKRQYDQAYELEKGESSGGSSGGSSDGSSDGSSGGKNSSKGNYDANTAAIQKQLRDAGYDIEVDGIWGPKTQAAYDDYNNGKKGNASLSTNGQNFMNNLPYPHAGSDMETWRNVVDERLERALNNGTLTEDDVVIILDKLGLA